MDSGASLTILHSDNPSQKSKNTITLEGSDGTISLASQTDNMAFQIGKDEFKEKAWLSRTGDGHSILGSDIMTTGVKSIHIHYSGRSIDTRV